MIFPLPGERDPIEWFGPVAILIGLLIGVLAVWRPSVGALWYCSVELFVPVATLALFLMPDLRLQGRIGPSIIHAIIPSWLFFIYSTAAAILVVLPACIIRRVISRPNE